MRLTIAEGHALILHDAVENQAFSKTIVQFSIVRGEPRNPTKRNNLCTDPFGDRSVQALRRASSNAARKFRAGAIPLVVVVSSLPSIVARKSGCVGNVHPFGVA